MSLALAPVASAQQGWERPVPASLYPGPGAVAVSGDGTTITANTNDHDRTEIRAGGAARFVEGVRRAQVAAGGRHELVAAWDDGARVMALAGRGKPVMVGKGRLAALAANEAGDMGLLIRRATTVSAAFRPAGGSFRAPVALSGIRPQTSGETSPAPGASLELALDPGGTMTVVAAGDDVRALALAPGGAGGAVTVLEPPPPPYPYPDPLRLTAFANAKVIVDAHGRAGAFWGRRDALTSGYVLDGAFRDAGGGWAPVEVPQADAYSGSTYDVGVGDAGDVVLAFSDCCGGPVRALGGSLPAGALGPSALLELTGSPAVATAPDGTTVIAAGHFDEVRAVRRDGTGDFSPAMRIACGARPAAGGHDRSGAAVIGFTSLGHGWATVREGTPAPGAPCEEALRLPLDIATSTSAPPHPFEPTRLELRPLVRPGWTVVGTDWDLDREPGYERTSRGLALEHTFRKLDDTPFFVRFRVRGPDGGVTQVLQEPHIYVGPELDLTLPTQRLDQVRRKGLRLRVSTATRAAVGREVWLGLYTNGRSSGRLYVRLTANPRAYVITLGRDARDRLARAAADGRAVKAEVRVIRSDLGPPPPTPPAALGAISIRLR